MSGRGHGECDECGGQRMGKDTKGHRDLSCEPKGVIYRHRWSSYGAFVMRTTLLALGFALCGGSVLGASALDTLPLASPPSRNTVYLDDAAALDALKVSNPDRYARARGIMAAANRLCRPGPPNVYF